MSLDFTSTLSRYIPKYFKARFDENKLRAFKFLAGVTVLADMMMQNTYEGLQASYPGLGTPTALPLIGRDRVIRRGANESNDSYARRLVKWRSAWKSAGNPFGIMRQVLPMLIPSVPLLRIVNATGTWYTLNPDDAIGIHQTWPTPNWNWDSDSTRPVRFWLIIYSNSGPWQPAPVFGDPGAPLLGDPKATIGTTATPAEVSTIRAILGDFKCAGDREENTIVAFDPASFEPAGAPGPPLPDGTWGLPWKIVDGEYVPSRNETARYFDGV